MAYPPARQSRATRPKPCATPTRIVPCHLPHLPTHAVPQSDLRLFGSPLEFKTALLMAGNPPIKVRCLAPKATTLNSILNPPEVWFEALRLRIYDSPPVKRMDKLIDDTLLTTLVNSVKVVVQLLQPCEESRAPLANEDSLPLPLPSLPKLNTFFQLLALSATELRLSNPGKP
jgi:hypothetical protein